ncbi:MAG: hypothetical protein QM723_25440 [Myxococcaceae bacterium]
MGLFEIIRQLNPLRTAATAKLADGIAAELAKGRGTVPAAKVPAAELASICVKRALEKFEQGPSAELIMLLLESSRRLWLGTARTLASTSVPGLERKDVRRSATLLVRFADSFKSDLMIQHVTNLVLSETGLGSEAMVLKPAQVNAARLAERLGELMRMALASTISAELELIPVPPPSPGRFASA